MSTQSVLEKNQGQCFFDRLPDVLVKKTFTYLHSEEEDPTILAINEICKPWQNHPVLKKERSDAAARILQAQTRRFLSQYPPEIVRVFEDSRTPMFELPKLDLGDQRGTTDYIDYLRPEDMTHSVMTFKDCCQRPGVAFKIQVRPSSYHRHQFSSISSRMRIAVQKCNLPKVLLNIRRFGQLLRNWEESPVAVLAIFKRYTPPESRQWAFGWGDGGETIQHLYTSRHNENGHIGPRLITCPNCLFTNNRVGETILSSLLKGEDPDFTLPGHHTPTVNQSMTDRRSLSDRTLLATAVAVVVIAYLANHYLMSEQI